MQSAIQPAKQQQDLNQLSLFTSIVVLAAVTMTFGALIAVFVIRSQSQQFWGHIQIPLVLWFTTAALIASSVTLEVGRRRLNSNDQYAFFRLTAWTTGLGTAFLFGQIAAWLEILHKHEALSRNPHSWFIFLFSGLHGLHIVLGLLGLAYLLKRTRRPASGPKFQMQTRAAATGVSVFWHYLDALWLVLFGLLLFWKP